MNNGNPHRGGSPVGYLNEFSDLEASTVIYFRLWCDGPDSQSKVYRDFFNVLGTEIAKESLKSLDKIYQLISDHGRRPLMRHDSECKCVGADESCFANLVVSAIKGENDDAMLIATLLVAPTFAPDLVTYSVEFGSALQKICNYTENTQSLYSFPELENSTIH